ncbi:MAG: hypothetical protein NTZ14_08525 [Hyphomicrobiales bacterium]|nr:hypothetical protein [Hyphomicrobiales bacterium]
MTMAMTAARIRPAISQRIASCGTDISSQMPTGSSSVAPVSSGITSRHCAFRSERAASGSAKGASSAQISADANGSGTTSPAIGMKIMAKPKPVKPRTKPPRNAAPASTASAASNRMAPAIASNSVISCACLRKAGDASRTALLELDHGQTDSHPRH